jgi:hypothetical protein
LPKLHDGGSLFSGRTAVRADSQEVAQMEANTYETYQGIVVPESVLVKREQANRYGSVEGLEDEELADPEELVGSENSGPCFPEILAPSVGGGSIPEVGGPFKGFVSRRDWRGL